MVNISKKPVFISILIVFTICFILMCEAAASIHIDRTKRKLYILDRHNKIFFSTKCGIGRGGLKEKKNMADLITPTGKFKVDIILYKDSDYNRVGKEITGRYKESSNYKKFFSDSKKSLSLLFKNMNSIDFDGNNIPDKAYGVAYIGLDSDGLDSDGAITGPKMRRYRGTPYWHSIAIHGTADKINIGKANSGGCIQLKKNDLKHIIENNLVEIGTTVIIADSPPNADGH